MSQYFRKSYESSVYNRNIKLDLPNYEPKAALKGATCVDTSNLAVTSNLAILKVEVDQLGVGKLKHIPADLSKLGNVVDNNAKYKYCV